MELGEREGFAFEKHQNSNRLKQVKLVGLGPKMLVSDLSSSRQSIMQWKLRVKGNTAVEFGVVPVSLQVCLSCMAVDRAVGSNGKGCVCRRGEKHCINVSLKRTTFSALDFARK